MKYKIGILEDNEEEIDKLERLLWKYKEIHGYDYDIVEFYDDKIIRDEGLDRINSQIIDSINNGKIHCLILDYKILSESEKVTGSDIHKLIHRQVLEFPIVLLTELKSECADNENIDPDKIYEKKLFFKVASEESNRYLANLYRNMERYNNIKKNLKNELEKAQRTLIESSDYNEEMISKILTIEKNLEYYEEGDQTEFDKTFNSDTFNEIIELINKVEEMEKTNNEPKNI